MQKPISSHGGIRPRTYGLVLHVQVGNGSLYGYFGNPANSVSSAYWVSKSGVIEQYYDDALTGWTQADGNSSWVAVETEGNVDEPLTDAQLDAVASLLSQLSDKYGFPIQNTSDVNGRGLGHHAMGGVAWGNHPCPGPIRIAQKDEIVARALRIGGHTLANGVPTSADIGGGIQGADDDMSAEDVAAIQSAIDTSAARVIAAVDDTRNKLASWTKDRETEIVAAISDSRDQLANWTKGLSLQQLTAISQIQPGSDPKATAAATREYLREALGEDFAKQVISELAHELTN